jgi:hypothetical protein
MASSTSEDKDIFYTVDPLSNIVYLTKERFYNHIVTEHLEMDGHDSTIKQTVENPDSIYKDKELDDTVCYISSHSKSTLSLYGDYLKVVVNRDLGGQVITAYPIGTDTDKGIKIYKKLK